jgi:NAD(P)-dependent dehydrogenase (short-subunit alcohol dehydrogenase family)
MIVYLVCLTDYDHVFCVLFQIRVNSVNPTVVWTDMAQYAWSDPNKSGPLLARIPMGKFVGKLDGMD